MIVTLNTVEPQLSNLLLTSFLHYRKHVSDINVVEPHLCNPPLLSKFQHYINMFHLSNQSIIQLNFIWFEPRFCYIIVINTVRPQLYATPNPRLSCGEKYTLTYPNLRIIQTNCNTDYWEIYMVQITKVPLYFPLFSGLSKSK